jgi:hypothetical protein
MKNNDEIFIKCDCHTEAIEIQHWKDDRSFYFSFWDFGRSKISWIPWRQRLKIIWRILRGKDLYADMVILDYEKAKQVANFINIKLEDVQSNNTKNQER